MVGPGALKPKVGDGIKSRRPLSAPVYTTFIHSSLVLCLLLHLYWCVYNNNNSLPVPNRPLRTYIKRGIWTFVDGVNTLKSRDISAKSVP